MEVVFKRVKWDEEDVKKLICCFLFELMFNLFNVNIEFFVNFVMGVVLLEEVVDVFLVSWLKG